MNEIEPASYERAWSEVFVEREDLVVGQREYGDIHKKRFWELVNAFALLIDGMAAPRILEIGASNSPAFTENYFPTSGWKSSIALMNRTTSVLPKPSAAASPAVKPFMRSTSPTTASSFQRWKGCPAYDLILFAEVLEHLPIHPLDLLPSLIQRLTATGALYLTTPNCFAYHKLLQIESRWNPQTIYPRQDGNWDAHHHYREYAAKELFEFIAEAGGE